MTEKTETTAPATIEAQVAAWSATTAELVAAVKATEGITVAGHAEGPKKGRAVVHAQLMTLQGHRTGIEKRRTELKRPILDLGKLVDSEAVRLTGIIAPREAELRADRDAYDAEQERIAAEAETKRKAEEAEEKRLRDEALQKRVSIVSGLGGQIDLVGLQTATEEEFAAQVATLTAERDERDRIAKAEREQREAAEAAERERVAEQQKKAEADRIERERVAAEERAEQKRIADANAAEAARLEKLRQETEAAAKKVQEDREAAERAEQDRKDAEAKKERDRLQAEADAKAETERLAQEEADRIAEAARIAALRPDREKIRAWVLMAREALPALPTIADAGLRGEVESCHLDTLNRLQSLLTETVESDA